jgi:hypothetical protein
MKVLLSWSGDRSKAVAEALHSWLRQVIQATEPFISTRIAKGAAWDDVLFSNLETTKVGIICLTRDNLEAPWLLFEAGALAKTKDARVCTFLLDLEPSDVAPPLSRFQHTRATEEDVKALVRSLNEDVRKAGERALDASDIETLWSVHWPRLKSMLGSIPAAGSATVQPVRDQREILEEILELVRGLSIGAEPALSPSATTLHLFGPDEHAAMPLRYRLKLAKAPVNKQQLFDQLGALPGVLRLIEHEGSEEPVIIVETDRRMQPTLQEALAEQGVRAVINRVIRKPRR